MTLDPSGLYAATSSSDKTISLFDFYSGECLAKLYGHSGGWGLLLINYFTIRNAHYHSYVLLSLEVVTQLQFSRDCKYLYSVAGDRLVWPVWLVLPDRTHIGLTSYPGCSSNFFLTTGLGLKLILVIVATKYYYINAILLHLLTAVFLYGGSPEHWHRCVLLVTTFMSHSTTSKDGWHVDDQLGSEASDFTWFSPSGHAWPAGRDWETIADLVQPHSTQGPPGSLSEGDLLCAPPSYRDWPDRQWDRSVLCLYLPLLEIPKSFSLSLSPQLSFPFLSSALPPLSLWSPLSSFMLPEEQDSSNFRLSVSQLPRWAQKQVIARPSIAKSISTGSLERATGQSKAPTPVEGRWAQVSQHFHTMCITLSKAGQCHFSLCQYTESYQERIRMSG